MKVLLINGSPHENGCTHTALAEMAEVLHKEGIETEEFWLTTEAVPGFGCKNESASVDLILEFLEKAEQADGFVFGSPVYFAGMSGQLKCFMDQVFCRKPQVFYHKAAAAVVSCRRGGATGAYQQICYFFEMTNMYVITSQYWNQVHGNTPEEVKQDLEGLQTMRTLGQNMAYFLKASEQVGIEKPVYEEKIKTSFIR